MRTFRVLAAALLVLAACGDGGAGPDDATTLLIAVNAPFSLTPYVGETIEQGARLAADEIAAAGGITAGERTYRFDVRRYDNALSPRRALENVRRALDDGAVAIIDEGTGLDATWTEAARAGVPLCVVYQGGIDMIDPEARPNVFRIAPTDHGVAFRYAEYLVPKGLKVALVHDDSDYGRNGLAAFDEAFGHVPEAIAARIGVPAASADVAPQVLRARRAGATALLVWGRSTTVVEVLRAARTSGWEVPVYAAQTGAQPLVRERLADRPEWVEGLVFAAGRLTAEVGPEPFLEFQRAYHEAFGRDEVGATTSEGEPVFQPPEYAMYSYDFVNVLAAAIESAGTVEPESVLEALEQVDVTGANGDERGFNEINHEGVVDDDVYFAVIRDMTYRPVEDDPLSSTLEVIDQTP